MSQHFLVKGKLVLNKVGDSEQELPTNYEVYHYLQENDYIFKLVDDIADYQMFYDDIDSASLDQNLILTFGIINFEGGENSDFRFQSFGKDLLATNEVLKDLQDSIDNFGDSCYEGSEPNEALYPDKDGGILAEISVTNLEVVEITMD